jgi:hypothetical protein
MKSIDDLKSIISDGSRLVGPDGKEVKISRWANNSLRLNNRFLSWSQLYDLLCNGSYVLSIKETQLEFDFKPIGQGGRRFGAGRRPIDPAKKRIVKSVTLSPEIIDRYGRYVDSFSGTCEKPDSFSSVVESALSMYLPV